MNKILYILIIFLLLGIGMAQYPYYNGYYGLANPYWSAQEYRGNLLYNTPGVYYYNIYNPGGYNVGSSAYDFNSRQYYYYINNNVYYGDSYYNPYW